MNSNYCPDAYYQPGFQNTFACVFDKPVVAESTGVMFWRAR